MKHFGPHICSRCKAILYSRVALEAGHVIWEGGKVRLSRMEALVFEALLRGFKENDRIIAHIYAFDPCGGPDDAYNNLKVTISHVRAKLAKAGFPGEIKTHWGIGYTLHFHDEGAPA